MKVCVFTASIDKKDGGPSRSVPILAKGLAEVGVSTTLLTLETDNMNTHILDGTNVDIIVLPNRASYKELEFTVMNESFDIIHAQNLWNPFYHKMAVIARRHRIPYIMTPRGTLEPWCLSQKAVKKRIALALYQRNDLQKASCVLATANMEAKHFQELGISSPIAIIPNGIDVSEYQCRQEKDKCGVKKQILFLSRIHEKKGIEILIGVWSKLRTRYPDWNVVIAGNGEDTYIQKLNSLLEFYHLENAVRIIPPVFGEQKHKLYGESSLFVLPSYSENFGMVIAEAMACGVPVITTTGTPWNILNEKELGWCIDLNEENLAQTISHAIEMGVNKLFDMGQFCSRYINETFQYTEVAKCNRVLYEWILSGTNKPSFIK